MARASLATPASPRPRGTAIPHALLVPLLALNMLMLRAQAYLLGTVHELRSDTRAFLGGKLNSILATMVVIFVSILGTVLGAQILADMLPDYFDAGGSIVQAFTNGTIDDGGFGDTTLHFMGKLIVVVVVFAPIGLVIGLFTFAQIKKGRGSAS